MSRKADIQAEETALNSPLRRSSRRTAVTNSPAPATLSSRRNSQSQTETIETKTPKTRRASLSQENLEKKEITENKPAPRGRRGSTAKEETEGKTEPAKTRSRRSSAATEPPAEETEKKQPVTRRRKSISVEEQAEPEKVKSVKSRRNSTADTQEKDTVERPVRSRRNSVKEEETKKEPPKKTLRGRRGSTTEETPEIKTKEKEPPTRGRRTSVDKLDDEPDTKIVKLTPVKSKRRLSVTENAVNLEPIKEQESEIKGRTSTSPQSSELKRAVVNLTDIKVDKDVKPNLDLSTIDESSFTEESLNTSTSEKKVLTPRKSPRLNKQKPRDSSGSSTPRKSKTMDIKRVDEKYSPEQNEMVNNKTKEAVTEKDSSKQIENSNENLEERADQNKVDLKNENIVKEHANESLDLDVEIKSEELTINETANESLELNASSRGRKLNFDHESTEKTNAEELIQAKKTGNIDVKEEENVETKHLILDKSDSHTESIDQSTLEAECERDFDHKVTEEINAEELIEAKKIGNIDVKEEENVQTEHQILDKSDSHTESIDQSILEAECEREAKEYNKQIAVETNKSANLDATLESDQSFNSHLHISNSENPDDIVEDDLNTSKNSSSSDKENIDVNSTKDPNVSKVNVADTQREIKGIIENNDHNMHKAVQNIVVRVSNVFRPNMKENSFMEPMEVDESILETSQIKKLPDLEECDVKNAPPAVSTPIVKRSIEEIGKIKGDIEESIEVSKVDQSIGESVDESEITSEVITVDSVLTLEESEAIYISKQVTTSKQDHTKENQASDTLSEQTSNVSNLETGEDTKMPRNLTFEINKPDQSGQEEHAERCESPLSDEEIEKTSLDKSVEDSSFEIIEKAKIEGTLQIKTSQIQQVDVKSESRNPEQMASDEMKKECFSMKLESETQSEKINTLMESDSNRQSTSMDELENETEKSSRSLKCSLIKSVVEIENEPILKKSGSPQPDQPSDELKPHTSGRSLRKSISPCKGTENLAVEQNIEQRRSSRGGSRSPVEKRETEMDQNKTMSLSRKSKSPRPQVVNTEELKSKNNEIPLLKSKRVSDETDIAEGEMKNLNVVLNRDKIRPKKSRSPQPEHQGVTEEKTNSSASSKSNISESELEPQTLPSLSKETSLQESSELKETGRMDISEDYVFEIPSDEEEADKSHKLDLEKDTIASDNQLVKSEISIIDEQVQKSPSSSPLKRKSIESEEEQSKKIKLAPTNASDFDVTSPAELPVPDETMNTETKIEESTNEVDMEEKSITDGLIERENLEDHKKLLAATEPELGKVNFRDEPAMNKEVIEDEISVQNEADDRNISAVHKDEIVNPKKDLTVEKSSAQMDVTEMETLEITRTGDELDQIVTDAKESNESQEISKTIEESSVRSTTDGDNVENANSNDAKEICTRQESTVMKDDFQEDSIDLRGKRGKKKSKTIKKSSVKGTQIDGNMKNAISEELDVMKSDVENITIEESSVRSTTDGDNVENANSNDAKEICTRQESTVMKDDFQEDSIDLRGKRGKKTSKTIKKSSVKGTQIDGNMINAILEELDVMKSDLENITHNSSLVKEGKKSKSKSEKRIDTTKQNKHTTLKEPETLEDISIVEPRSLSHKKSKKVRTVGKGEENSYEDRVEERQVADKSRKIPIVDKNKVIESGKKKKSKKSSFEGSNEKEFSNNRKKEKQKKPSVEDVTLESEEDSENEKKERQKEMKHVNSNQNGSPRKRVSEGLEAFAISKLDNYLSTEISQMESEDGSYYSSGAEEEEEEDNSKEDNDFIYTMAEEGEEDTPSEGSNDIIDEGESINSTDSEIDSEEDYDLDDSFICDGEDEELLSGEEYDLGDEKRKKKKSRIIQLDDCDDEIIKIKRKEKPIKKTKRSRIIPVSDSSDSDLDKNCDEGSLNESVEKVNDKETVKVKEIDDDDVIILEEMSTPLKFSNNQMASSIIDIGENSTRKRKKSIIIHENINVAEIKNPDFSEKIANVVDTFCNKLSGGELSMNLSLEHAVDHTAEHSQYDDSFIKRSMRDKHFPRNSMDSDDSGALPVGEHSKKQQRLSFSFGNIEDAGKSKQKSRKKRKSVSLDDLSTSKEKKSKISRGASGKRKNMEKAAQSKKKTKSQKRDNGSKPPTNSPEDLRTNTLSIMDELITDVKNRPVRTIKPSTTVTNMNGSWVSEVADVQPSTTLVKREEPAGYKPGKIHPKDFRTRMLYDSSRVRRVDTKTLLRKKGAYF